MKSCPQLEALALETVTKAVQILELPDPYIVATAQINKRKALVIVLDERVDISPAYVLETAEAFERAGFTERLRRSVPLTNKDREVIELLRIEGDLSRKEIATRLGLSKDSSMLRARLANLTAQQVLISSARDGYRLGPNAPPGPDGEAGVLPAS